MPLKHLLKRQLIFLFLLAAIASFIFNACRKHDVQKNVTDPALIEQFFKIPENASPQLKAIIADVRKQNEQYNFIKYFIEKNGWPHWQDAEIVGKEKIVANIPFVKQGESEVNGFFFTKLDTVTGRSYQELYRKSLYQIYSIDDKVRSLNPYGMQMIINHHNQKIFGIDTFRFYDQREVPKELVESYGTSINWESATCQLKPAIASGNTQATARYEISCNTITTCYQGPVLVGDAGNHPPTCYDELYCYGSGGGGDGSGGGWGPNPDPHSGSGGGGTYNPPSNPYWWQGGGVEEDAAPPVVKDSTFYKNYLAKISDSIKSKANAVFNVAQRTLEEWSFVISGKDSSVHAINDTTDHESDQVTMNYVVPTGEILLGEGHTHQNDNERLGYGLSCSIVLPPYKLDSYSIL